MRINAKGQLHSLVNCRSISYKRGPETDCGYLMGVWEMDGPTRRKPLLLPIGVSLVAVLLMILMIVAFGERTDQYGLKEADRQRIWSEVVATEDRAHLEANLAYPIPDIRSPDYARARDSGVIKEQIYGRAELSRRLAERYRGAVLRQEGVTKHSGRKSRLRV